MHRSEASGNPTKFVTEIHMYICMPCGAPNRYIVMTIRWKQDISHAKEAKDRDNNSDMNMLHSDEPDSVKKEKEELNCVLPKERHVRKGDWL